MSKVNIVLATDANYLRYAEITLKSLLAHNQNLSVFIMCTGDISQEWGDRLTSYFEKRNSTLKFVYFDVNHLSSFSSSSYISTATYLRFYIPLLFQYSESPYWIYLDCDIVINGDVTSPFYQYNFANYALGAVSDPYVNSLSHSYINQDYFNAGVLYLNKNKVQSGNYTSFTYDLFGLANELKDNVLFGDQDLLNFYFKDNWLSLSQEYNFQLANMKLYNKREKVNPAIIHFTGPVKPLGPISIKHECECVKNVISLFRIYDSVSWDDIVNLPIGTITLKISD